MGNILTVEEWMKKREDLIMNYVHKPVIRLRKELKTIWKEQGRNKVEVSKIEDMKKKKVCAELLNYYDREIAKLINVNTKSAV